jgi:AhpD family alkylhydroperoxidase
MANRPEALKNFVPFYASLVGPGSVDRRTKVMAYLVTSYANRCAFCIAANVPGGRKAGLRRGVVSEGQIVAHRVEDRQQRGDGRVRLRSVRLEAMAQVEPGFLEQRLIEVAYLAILVGERGKISARILVEFLFKLVDSGRSGHLAPSIADTRQRAEAQDRTKADNT